MNKILLYILLLLMPATMLHAAKSSGVPHAVVQPDGTTLMVQLLGDEHFSWYQTTDGALLLRQGKAFYIAKVLADGRLQSTRFMAHDAGKRGAKELQAVSEQNHRLFFAQAQTTVSERHNAVSNYPSGAFCPHSGTVRVPVIMMEYTDVPFSFDRDVFEDYFNGTTKTPYSSATKLQGYSSVAQYFSDASFGNLQFVFDLYGPYKADNAHDYYGKAGGNSFSLLTEAVSKADGDIDFSKYDSNNDGKVDMAYILYAGTGANLSGNNNDFWPACWHGKNISTQDGKHISIIGGANELTVSDYNGSPLRAGIGVTCHEISHGLGMPDLYWTSATAPRDAQGYVDYNNCGPEDWDLMDGGENLYNAMWPCQYAAWERDIMGWKAAEVLSEPSTVTLFPLNKEGGKACKVVNPQNDNEYYVIENIAKDEWNYYLNQSYGSGLMITHVNANSDGLSMSPNNTYGRPNVTLLPADGFVLALYSRGQTIQYNGEVVTMPSDNSAYRQNYFIPEAKGDHYPGLHNVTSVAAYKNYTGDDMVGQYPITNIKKNSDGSITFEFMGGDPALRLKCDVDGNRIVNIADLAAIVNVLNNTTEYNPLADVNNDGTVDTNDISFIIDYLLQGGSHIGFSDTPADPDQPVLSK